MHVSEKNAMSICDSGEGAHRPSKVHPLSVPSLEACRKACADDNKCTGGYFTDKTKKCFLYGVDGTVHCFNNKSPEATDYCDQFGRMEHREYDPCEYQRKNKAKQFECSDHSRFRSTAEPESPIRAWSRHGVHSSCYMYSWVFGASCCVFPRCHLWWTSNEGPAKFGNEAGSWQYLNRWRGCEKMTGKGKGKKTVDKDCTCGIETCANGCKNQKVCEEPPKNKLNWLNWYDHNGCRCKKGQKYSVDKRYTVYEKANLGSESKLRRTGQDGWAITYSYGCTSSVREMAFNPYRLIDWRKHSTGRHGVHVNQKITCGCSETWCSTFGSELSGSDMDGQCFTAKQNFGCFYFGDGGSVNNPTKIQSDPYCRDLSQISF